MNPDLALFRLINITWGWEGLAPVMRVASGLVYFAPVILLLVVWMVWKDGVRGRVTVLTLAVLITASDQVSSHFLKPLVGRPRPCRAEAGIEGVRTHGARCSGSGSFPSSHAANMAAVAALLGWRYRRWAIPAWLLALLVGYSRVYLGVHYPLDVAGGWVLGAGLGAAAAWGAARGQGWWERRRAATVSASG